MGNYLIYPSLPPLESYEQHVGEHFCGVPIAHRALCVCSIPSDDSEYATSGFGRETFCVMTAREARGVPPPNGARLRKLTTDGDWHEASQLYLASYSADALERGESFKIRQMHARRALCERDLGGWFAAELNGKFVSSMGIFRTGEGQARFQDVETLETYRGMGIASWLLVEVANFARTVLGSEQLVIATHENNPARRIYERRGFREVSIERSYFKKL